MYEKFRKIKFWDLNHLDKILSVWVVSKLLKLREWVSCFQGCSSIDRVIRSPLLYVPFSEAIVAPLVHSGVLDSETIGQAPDLGSGPLATLRMALKLMLQDRSLFFAESRALDSSKQGEFPPRWCRVNYRSALKCCEGYCSDRVVSHVMLSLIVTVDFRGWLMNGNVG